MPFSRMNPRMWPSSHLAQTTQMSAMGELVILSECEGLLLILKVDDFYITIFYECCDSAMVLREYEGFLFILETYLFPFFIICIICNECYDMYEHNNE